MLDTGNIYDLATRPDVPDWTSQTWEIDWDNNRLLSKRIDGKDAIAQGAIVALSTDYLKYPIFSDLFGSEFFKFIGERPGYFKAHAERLVKECLSPDLRINRVTNFKITDLDKNTFHLEFTLETIDGDVDLGWEVSLE